MYNFCSRRKILIEEKTVRVDTIWYTVFCSKSVHFRASLVVLALKYANNGNDDEVNAENDDAPGAFN